MIPSYPKIFALGHRAIADLFKDPVVVQEKVDGSQFSFALLNGELHFRSKGQDIVVSAPEKMFVKGVEYIVGIQSQLTEDYIYRAEFLSKPKHNTLTYDRAPKNNLVLFDVQNEMGEPVVNVTAIAHDLGIDCVPVLFAGMIGPASTLQALLGTESFLGGPKIEGVVIKNYHSLNRMGDPMFGKFVSEEFKERNDKGWKRDNPGKKDVIEALIGALTTEARWRKSVQHLSDLGRLESAPQDIGPLIKLLQKDIEEEELDHITKSLLKWALPQILRGTVRGFPEWYKEELVKLQFDGVTP